MPEQTPTSPSAPSSSKTVPSSPPPLLSVVIPAYNEEKRLPGTIRRVEQYLSEQDYTWELLVVDDGSKDRTVEVAQAAFGSPNSRVQKNPRNMGKGATVRNGMLAARGDSAGAAAHHRPEAGVALTTGSAHCNRWSRSAAMSSEGVP